MTTKTINSEKFLELVQMLNSQSHIMPGMEPLIELFNELGRLMGEFDKEQDEEGRAKLWEAANACNSKLQAAFTEMCKGWGFSPEELHAVINDPKNYSAEEWGIMQDIKRQAESVMDEEQRRTTKTRKTRKWV